MSRDFCKEINFVFDKKVLKKATRLNLIQKIALKFIKPTVTVEHGFPSITTITKVFRGKLFIIAQYENTPTHYNCRHQPIKHDYKNNC